MTGCEQFVSNEQAPAATAASAPRHGGASLLVTGIKRRAWDSNPRERSPVLAVFKSQEFEPRRVNPSRVKPFLQVIDGPLDHVGPQFGVPKYENREQPVSNPLA